MDTTPIRQWKFDAKDQDGVQVGGEIEAFIKATGLDDVASGRISRLLVLPLFGATKAGVVDPLKVVHEIRLLEEGKQSTLKPPIQNKHAPLKNLWHKHYLQTGLSSMAMNIQTGLKRYSIPFFQQKIREAEEAGEERFVTADDIPAIVSDAVHGNLNRLREESRMTGEWLIFAKYEGQNYYLTMATHDVSTHQHIRQQIDGICCWEFPFLKGILEA